uniref:Putative ixodes 8-cys protein n=1 Tax=Ixodes ricinus TaxID=34613 RepID=A0A0K8RAR7_IXORI
MFKLKLFILFALAGLCFGQASGVDSGDSGVPSPDDASSLGSKGENDEAKQSEESPSGGDSGSGDGEVGPSPGGNGDSGDARDGGKPAGTNLPSFIGTPQQKKSYVDSLVKNCGNDNTWKVNENNITISLQKCTYTCQNISNTDVTKELRIPPGMVCGSHDAKCGESGDCPVILPSC